MRLGLLGLGNVGSAVARTARAAADVLAARGVIVRVTSALVRDPSRPRSHDVPADGITTDPDRFFSRPHDIVVEVLGGVEPAAELVARALEHGIPVVTANKSLLAARGRELVRLAERRRVPFRFEASVVAGVPFLSALDDRPLAGAVSRIEGILNGTTNFILTLMAARAAGATSAHPRSTGEHGEENAFAAALAEAQTLGLAEPQPQRDISGRDAAEKLCVLLRHVARLDVPVDRVATRGIDSVTSGDIAAAHERGGVIKPIARAVVSGDRVEASVEPCFLPLAHPLARVDDALNGVLIESRYAGTLFYAGPGAGPDVTAATILDDVAAIATELDRLHRGSRSAREKGGASCVGEPLWA